MRPPPAVVEMMEGREKENRALVRAEARIWEARVDARIKVHDRRERCDSEAVRQSKITRQQHETDRRTARRAHERNDSLCDQ